MKPSHRIHAAAVAVALSLVTSVSSASDGDLPATRATSPAASTTPTPAPTFTPSIDVIAQYALRDTRAQDGSSSWFHQFEVPRVWLGLEASEGDVHGRVILEGVRSAGEGALVGIGGDSIVARVREAWAGYRAFDALEIRAGIVPTLVLPTLDATWALRSLGPTSLEAYGLSSPADLGATASVALPDGYGTLSAGAFNGEGYTNRELNRGKSSALSALIRPMPRGALAPLALFASYERGSAGTGSTRADRLVGAVLFTGERVQGLASATYAWGADGDGARRAWVLEAGVKASPIGPLLLAARGAIYVRDAAAAGDAVRTVTLAVGARASTRLEGWLAFDRRAPTGAAREALPGSDDWQLRAVARVAF
jgi:hypothetical protein